MMRRSLPLAAEPPSMEPAVREPGVMEPPERWDRLPLDALLERCRELVEDPEHPTVHRWRAAGGKVVGHFQ
ncbi:MAG: hypothetical protein HY561_06190, partial [Gemmatimonadetes bacterium]|nr:hypothetical protein [Gemmatimonadota bacterium]